MIQEKWHLAKLLFWEYFTKKPSNGIDQFCGTGNVNPINAAFSFSYPA
jgi:hypothetical protein